MTLMLRQSLCAALAAILLSAPPALAQRGRGQVPSDPWAGSWRGTLTTPQSAASIQQLETALADLERQETQLSENLGENHPDRVKVRSQIEESKTRLDAEVAKGTNVTITLVAGDDGYTGRVTGFGPGTEIQPGFPISLWYLTARTSRRALISGAPTQGPSLRRVTPGG